MESIISPVDKRLIRPELSKEKFLRYTNFENNEIYVITSHDSPNTMKEVGRLREIAYRDSGGGSGKPYDIDDFDTAAIPYKQIIVWNPNLEEIIGGYRFLKLIEAKKDNKKNQYHLFTTDLFGLSEKFINEYLPYTIELGKSFVQPQFQPSTDERKGFFSLDNLWDGLGALIVDNPDIKYFYGRVTLYLNYDQEARDILLHFLDKYFGDKENLIFPYDPRKTKTDKSKLEKIFSNKGFEEDFTNLNQAIRDRNENIPPLIKAYMSLSPSMKTFGVAYNHKMGNVECIGIMINLKDIYPSKIRRHVESYKKQKQVKK